MAEKGQDSYFRCRALPAVFKVTNCDLKLSHSSFVSRILEDEDDDENEFSSSEFG
jgi:hypothetical protein